MKKHGSNAAKISEKKPRGKGVPFKANDPVTGEKDPRINREGKPPVFADLRKMAINLLVRKTESKDKEGKVIGEFTQAEMVLISWLASQDFQKQNRLMEIAWGKVPDEVHHITDEADFVRKYIKYYTDGELDRIQAGESGMDILFSKIDGLFVENESLKSKISELEATRKPKS